MNLVVLAEDVDSVALKNVAKVSEASAIEQITTRSFRLVGAKPVEGLVAACAAGGSTTCGCPRAASCAISASS